MAATARELIPFDVWPGGITSAATPANDNAMRAEVIGKAAVSFEATQPVSPVDGDLYILSAAWGDEVAGTLAYYKTDTFYFWIPFEGMMKWVEESGEFYQFSAASTEEWTVYSPNSTEGKQAIYISASGMRPTTTAGCAALAQVEIASNNPELVTLDFDPTTVESALFSFVMPEKWNEGTITFKAHWSHGATTVNFGVAWGLQAVAVSNDDTIATTFGTRVDVVDTGGTTNDLYTTPESSAVTIGGTPQPGDMVFFRFRRTVADAGDTLAIDARLHGVTIYITTNAGTDA